MAKKATTIILVIVVLFLLASTVYVSIILTSDTGTTPRPSKASEVEEGAESLPQDETTEEELPQDPLAVTEDESGAKNESLIDNPLAQPPEDISPIETVESNRLDLSVSPEVTPGEDDEELLAYANPSPTGRVSQSKTPTAEPTKEFGREPTANTVDELPESGKGQLKTTTTPTQAKQQLSQTMPVAGNLTGPIAAFVVAGATILFAFVL